MDIGVKAICANCCQEYYMYQKIHGRKPGMMIGRCPSCGTMGSAVMSNGVEINFYIDGDSYHDEMAT